MGLETATHINDLVTTNPTGSDDRSTADDHLRLIKSVLKTDLPLTAAVTATAAELNKLAGFIGAIPPLGTTSTWTARQIFGAGIRLEDNDTLDFGTAGAEGTMYSDGVNLVMNLLTGKDFIIRDAAGAVTRFLFDSSTGDFHADGDITAFSTTVGSDPKLKKDIEPLNDALAKIRNLQGVKFKWKKNDKPSAGLLSTDVENVLPEAVETVDPKKDGETYQAVNYNAIIGLLVESVKMLDNECRKNARRLEHQQKIIDTYGPIRENLPRP